MKTTIYASAGVGALLFAGFASAGYQGISADQAAAALQRHGGSVAAALKAANAGAAPSQTPASLLRPAEEEICFDDDY